MQMHDSVLILNFSDWIKWLNYLMGISCDKINTRLGLPIPHTPQERNNNIKLSLDDRASYPNANLHVGSLCDMNCMLI